MRVVKYIKCAICGDRQKPEVLYEERITKVDEKVYSARRTPDRQHFRFMKCQRCGLIFSNPIFSPKKINALYKKSDLTYKDESDYLRKTYTYYLKKFINNKNPEELSLLEIGCGNGFFLEEVINMGLKKVYGVEPGIQSVKKAHFSVRKKITVDILRPKLFKNAFFDVVCCFHTFDHIIDPNMFLSMVKQILKPGGIAFFVVHDTRGLSVMLLGERSPIFDIEHIYLFDKRTLPRIFQKNGFRVIDIFEITNTYPLKYWLRLFPLPNNMKTIFLKWFFATKLGLVPIKIRAGNIGIIVKK